MAKKSSEDHGARGRLIVICSAGSRQRFLRGIITHDLMQRGLSFDDAYAAARAVRDRLAEREEVSTAEIRDLLQQHLETVMGGDVPPLPPAGPRPGLVVIKDGNREPYSRGLLARSIRSAGVDFDRAYRLIADLEAELREENVTILSNADVVARVSELMAGVEGKDAARRYQLMRRLDRLPRPLVLFIGGASGTGKSTLALELAPLLRIYRINATDTIRQVMRMVFSPQMLPALYTSSFEIAQPPGSVWAEEPTSAPDDDTGDALMASFAEQATRVNVGVRAMVERAAAENMSMLVEGVHLYPPMVPFGDLEGMVFQVPLLLATRDRDVHRGRLLGRGLGGPRRAERYLERFVSIRAVHDFLLDQADTHDVPLLDTSFGDLPVESAVRLTTSLLQRRLPNFGTASEGVAQPALLVIIDGLADRAVRALGGRTPLAAAKTPTLDRLASEGRCGLADPVAAGVVPDTAAGSLALFGQPPHVMKRGPVEALGVELGLRSGDIALRGNFATVDKQGVVLDRRAGRIRDDASALAKALDRLRVPGIEGDIEVRVKAATEHRLAIVLRGEGLSPAIRGSDPGDGAAAGPALVPAPMDPDDERAAATANALSIFEQAARKTLAGHARNKARKKAGLPQANAVLTRGAGRAHRLPPLEAEGVRLRWSCIGGDRTILGLARWLGADVVMEDGMTANLDTDIAAKLAAAERALQRQDLAVVHLKGADIAAHDRRPDLKAAFLERVDRHLGALLERWEGPLRIAVAGDHATLSESGQHAADPLPVVVWGTGIEADEVTTFDEQAAASGALQRFPLQILLGRLFERS